MRIQILVYDGFDDLDAIAPHEVFTKAHETGAAFLSTLVVQEAQHHVYSSSGLALKVPKILDLSHCDLLIVPGGGWANRAETGAWQEYQKGRIPEIIQRAHEAKIRIASVCTGALLVAKSGLLNNRPASTHHTAREDLAKLGALVKMERVVDDGDILSAGGITSGIDLALYILEKFGSAELAKQVSRQLEYEGASFESKAVWQKT